MGRLGDRGSSCSRRTGFYVEDADPAPDGKPHRAVVTVHHRDAEQYVRITSRRSERPLLFANLVSVARRWLRGIVS